MKIKIIDNQGEFYQTINAINCEDFVNQFLQDCDESDFDEEEIEHWKDIYNHLDDDHHVVDDTEYTGYMFINCD